MRHTTNTITNEEALQALKEEENFQTLKKGYAIALRNLPYGTDMAAYFNAAILDNKPAQLEAVVAVMLERGQDNELTAALSNLPEAGDYIPSFYFGIRHPLRRSLIQSIMEQVTKNPHVHNVLYAYAFGLIAREDLCVNKRTTVSYEPMYDMFFSCHVDGEDEEVTRKVREACHWAYIRG